MRRPAVVGLLLLIACAPLSAEERRPSGWMGVMLAGARSDVADGDAGAPGGATVSGVIRESPADRAGLRARDRILSVDGVAVTSVTELIEKVKGLDPGSWIGVEIERGEGRRELRIRLGERPAGNEQFRLRRGWIGIESIDLPPELRLHFGAPEDAGAMVSALEPGSPAEAAGFELGDVVYEIEGEPVASAAELATWIKRGGVGNTLTFVLVRNGAEIELEAAVVDEPEEPADPGSPGS